MSDWAAWYQGDLYRAQDSWIPNFIDSFWEWIWAGGSSRYLALYQPPASIIRCAWYSWVMLGKKWRLVLPIAKHQIWIQIKMGEDLYISVAYHIIFSFRKSYIERSSREQMINTSLAAPGALAHRLQRRSACKIQNGHQWAPKWLTGSGKVSTPRFLGILSNFH